MDLPDNDLKAFINSVRDSSQYDFSGYSEKSLKRRVAKLLADNKLTISELTDMIKNDPVFLEKIVKDITVNTTELFRDPEIWHTLRYQILPEFKNKESINIWHVGCSTGQEVYSMLILLNEMELFDKATVFATDINSDVLKLAKAGTYKYLFNIGYLDNFDKVIKENPHDNEVFFDVPYSKYLRIDKTKDIIEINKFLREKPNFIKHDMVKDENIFDKKFDLILCRNVVIYFNYELQNKVFSLFYNNLKQNGYLILGVHETILGPFNNKFEKKGQVYLKKEIREG